MTSPSRNTKRTKYFSYMKHRQQQQRQWQQSVIISDINKLKIFINLSLFIHLLQNQNLDEALARAFDNMQLQQDYVPREWYERLWRNYQNLERDFDNLNIRFKFGLGLWRLVIILVIIYFLIKFISFIERFCQLSDVL
jgi:hypothetical protein